MDSVPQELVRAGAQAAEEPALEVLEEVVVLEDGVDGVDDADDVVDAGVDGFAGVLLDAEPRLSFR